MILFLYGKDTFRSRQHLKKMIQKFKDDRDPAGYNVVRLDAASEKPERIMGEILASPFLAGRRFVAVESLLASKCVQLQKDLSQRIEEKRLPETTVLVFWEGIDTFKTKDAKALFEQLLREKYCQHFEELDGAKRMAWILSEIKGRGATITHDAVQYIETHADLDTWFVSSLLDQLTAYTYGREICQEDVELFLNEKIDANIFNLVDCVIAGKLGQAFPMIQEQYRRGEDAQFIFAMLLRQFRILLNLRDLLDRDGNIQQDLLAKKLKLHPFVVKKSLPLVTRYSLQALRKAYSSLLEVDVNMKTGQGAPETLLDVFTARVGAYR